MTGASAFTCQYCRGRTAIAVRGMGAADIPETWRPYWTGVLEP
jgi:hypothetical protein